MPSESFQRTIRGRLGLPTDIYWRFDSVLVHLMMEDSRKLLEPHKYPCKGSTEGLKYFALRALRCLPSYERHKVSELRLLAHQRGIDVATKAIRKQMIEALCLADENSHFERFLDLPAELRERIYELHCADFADEVLTNSTYPPLARLDKQFRDKLLPIFYKDCTFGMVLMADSLCNKPVAHVLRGCSARRLFSSNDSTRRSNSSREFVRATKGARKL
jgi:hypothetical protein